MDFEARRFRVLVAEDDPVSRDFLLEAMRACGAAVRACADGRAALALARTQHWDLLLLDHHLPGLAGDAVLRALRADEAAASRDSVAVATSAAGDHEVAALCDAGFAEVLAKPTTVDALRRVLHRHGGPIDTLLDDAKALAACGSAVAVTRLRRLLLDQELPGLLARLAQPEVNPGFLRPVLHRLHAACGFCGTRALADTGWALDRALASGARDERLDAALDAFRTAVRETRAALAADLAAPHPASPP